MSTSSNRTANRLIHTESPYLRQHAYNPVDWYPWGDEALQKAQKENKLLIVSIGYSACHWCHVMERESFENVSIAALMNKHFVSIKVDREERPDLDNLYMQAATLISGRGGWPLNVIALPDGRPIYGGTYYPAEQWSQLLTFFHKAYQDDRAKLLEQAEQISQGIRQMEVLPPVSSDGSVTPEWHDELVGKWLPELDKDWGGAAGAPKFPMPANWTYLLAYQHLHGDDKVRSILSTTLDRMAWGGLYDPVGGGFARYSTDARWHVPHFEKMLYDNAQLLTLYSQAFSATGNLEYARVAEQTIRFLNRELRHQHGGYYCALDADSEGEEGKFYVFTHQEWSQVLGADAKLMAAIYSITKAGNWEHDQNVLFRTRPLDAFAKEQDLALPRFLTWHDEQMEKLRSFRDQRERPGLDDKILTSWNALAIAGLCSAYDALGKKQYLADAEKTYQFLRSTAWQGNGAVWRNLKGKPEVHGFLDDHGLLAWAAIQLYHTTFDPAYLNDAQVLVEYVLNQFTDSESPFFFYTPSSQEALVTRQKELSDNVIPASNSVMALVLYRLGHLLDRKEWIERAEQMFASMKSQIARQPRFFANWAMLGLEMAHKLYEVAIVGPEAESLRMKLASHYLPNAWFLGSEGESALSLLQGKYQAGKTLIYVCQNKTCRQPVATAEEALKELASPQS